MYISDITTIIIASLSTYIMACVLGASSLFEPLRMYIKRTFPKLQIGQHKHFIECRLCLSFWTSLLVCLMFKIDIVNFLPVYGLSYWLCTQER